MSYVLQFIRDSEYPTSERQWVAIWLGVTASLFVLLSVSMGLDTETVLGSLFGGVIATGILGVLTAGLLAVQRYDSKRRAQ